MQEGAHCRESTSQGTVALPQEACTCHRFPQLHSCSCLHALSDFWPLLGPQCFHPHMLLHKPCITLDMPATRGTVAIPAHPMKELWTFPLSHPPAVGETKQHYRLEATSNDHHASLHSSLPPQLLLTSGKHCWSKHGATPSAGAARDSGNGCPSK